MPITDPEMLQYMEARRAHADWLRNEGLKWHEVGERLGIGEARARELAQRHVADELAKVTTKPKRVLPKRHMVWGGDEV